ncbi:MAG: DUF6524 family protein [Patescibacteria group bacterium]
MTVKKKKTGKNFDAVGTMSTGFKIFGYTSVLMLCNPTGFSYFHVAKDYAWFENVPMSLVMMTIGAIIAGMAIFMISGAWNVTEKLGKFIFLAVVGPAMGAIAFTQWFDFQNPQHWTSMILAVVLLFVFFGAAYPRARWMFQRTRQVEDSDTDDDFA